MSTTDCPHEWKPCFDPGVKYRCALCKHSGYRYPSTGVVIAHTHNRPPPSEAANSLALVPGGVFNDYGHRRLGKHGPGSY